MARIVDHDELLRIVADCKADRRVVVMANGAFDLLHVGHIRYLHGAAAEGGRPPAECPPPGPSWPESRAVC